MRRVLFWLLPEYASLPASEREPMDRGMDYAAIGVLAFGMAITGLEMLLELLVPAGALGVARAAVFMLFTMASGVIISRASFSSSHSTLVFQAEMKAAMRRQVLHDPLTDLPNRMYLEDRAESALQGRTADDPLVLLMIDLDEFKQVNDRLGHAQGDRLLQEIARRLRQAVDDDVDSLVARLSGDEFAILSERVTSDTAAQELVERVRANVERPFMLAGELVSPSASIGVATFPRDGWSLDALLHTADLAMYRSKFGRRAGDRAA
jgi:diguanylate cyclase (GGDEF)-like protein